jgi:hypothetical protein
MGTSYVIFSYKQGYKYYSSMVRSTFGNTNK